MYIYRSLSDHLELEWFAYANRTVDNVFPDKYVC